jgi:SAM-dependent methyltransferase
MNLTALDFTKGLRQSLLLKLKTTRVSGEPYSPLELAKHLWISRNWNILGPGPLVKIRNQFLLTNPYYWKLLFSEWKAWEMWYLPSNGLDGKVVLDVGAGTGESALFFYHHRARKVIAVEPNPEALTFLHHNKDLNRWNMQIIEEPFKLDQLKLPFDFAKIDCEGAEILLTQVSELPPCNIEVHSQETLDALLHVHPDLSVFPGQSNPWELLHD